VARRFNVDRWAISRATQRVSQDPELPAATKTIQRELELVRINIETAL
jgi:predicted regulator of amino acid metabolism with ACT domain